MKPNSDQALNQRLAQEPASKAVTTAVSTDNTELADGSRRRFLQGFGAMVGGVSAAALISGNGISVAMAYTPSADSASRDGKLLTQKELQILQQICAIVIPKTDTLGAAEVDTHGFIDNQLFHCFKEKQQQQIRSVFKIVDSSALARHRRPFLTLSGDHKFTLLSDLDIGQQEFDADQRSAFKSLKKLICFGYYTSEVGASQELRYLAVPGGYKGSIPYNGKDAAWGSLGLHY